MHDRFASWMRLRFGFPWRLRVRPGQSCSIELPPISGYGPLPDSSWLLILALAAILVLLLANPG
jgi:hypothetical protein